MYLVDSDFDSDDEAYADDIEEVISNQIVNSFDSDLAAPIIEEDIVIENEEDGLAKDLQRTDSAALDSQ